MPIKNHNADDRRKGFYDDSINLIKYNKKDPAFRDYFSRPKISKEHPKAHFSELGYSLLCLFLDDIQVEKLEVTLD